MNKFSNVISISGAGRNVGKTYLGESIISYFSKEHSTIAIKISKFKHKATDKEGLQLIYCSARFSIWKEINFSEKDSGRYFRAGAKESYYIECDDVHLKKAFLYIYKAYNKSCLFICESASLTKYINPSLSVFVESAAYVTEKNKLSCLNRSNIVLKEHSIEISMPQLFLTVQNNCWNLKYSKKKYCHGRFEGSGFEKHQL